MKNESLNGTLTFVLGALVILGVFFALKVVFITHETHQLQAQASEANVAIIRTQAVFNEAQAYNQRYRDPELARILDSIRAKPATR